MLTRHFSVGVTIYDHEQSGSWVSKQNEGYHLCYWVEVVDPNTSSMGRGRLKQIELLNTIWDKPDQHHTWVEAG